MGDNKLRKPYGNRNVEQYICNYCMKAYVPKKRGVQKFCSPSCRVRFCKMKTASSKRKGPTNDISKEELGRITTKNSFLGSLGANVVTELGKHLLDKSSHKDKQLLLSINQKLDALLSFADKETRKLNVNNGKEDFELKEVYNSQTKRYRYFDENEIEYIYQDGSFYVV